MPSFRPLPKPHPGVEPIHPPVSHALVDCAVYVDGVRLPEKYTHAAAVDKVHALKSQGANVHWPCRQLSETLA